jgi:hypothetical protein
MGASRPCTNPRCPNLQPCELHQRKPFATAQRSSDLYKSHRWRILRIRHLKANPYCADCYLPGNTVDHEPPHRGDVAAFFDERRFVTRCTCCHNRKTGRETRARAAV